MAWKKVLKELWNQLKSFLARKKLVGHPYVYIIG